jgi:pSer/pThr/pTyr-binding forkhead associated (FHA) protein
MEEWLIDLATSRGYGFVDHVRVQLNGDTSVRRRTIYVDASIIELPNFNRAEQEQIQRTEVMRVIQSTGSVPPRLLRYVGGPHEGEAIIIRRPRLSVGRALDNDLVVDSAEVSRHHARVEYRDGQFWVVDQGSTNGTTVNGYTVAEQQLTFGDRITFGNMTLEFLPYEARRSAAPANAS